MPATVRQVLDMLVNEGLIYRQRGRGTFVAHPTVEQAMVRIVSFDEDMRQRGLEPSTVVLFSRLVPASAEIAVLMEIEAGEELARLERLFPLPLYIKNTLVITGANMVGQIGGWIKSVAVQDDYTYVGVGPRLFVLNTSDPASTCT